MNLVLSCYYLPTKYKVDSSFSAAVTPAVVCPEASLNNVFLFAFYPTAATKIQYAG